MDLEILEITHDQSVTAVARLGDKHLSLSAGMGYWRVDIGPDGDWSMSARLGFSASDLNREDIAGIFMTAAEAHAIETDLPQGSSRFAPGLITPGAIRSYRDRTGSSVVEAKVDLHNQALGRSLSLLMSEGGIEDKIDWLIARYAEEKRIPMRHRSPEPSDGAPEP
ncbi:hypothetical protein ACEUZ9_000981 [Paracoccus litorisediminis]|uniref:hypothetical protein n=1 Tax=Paracoccus litorisediminis TaxID=2006130 RepID=UPI00373160FA